MAETIRGINVQIGADTTKLGKALENVNKKSKSIQSELRQVERLLKFDPGNTEALAQKQELLAEQISATSEKLNKLRSVQKQVNEQFKRGDISEAQYRAFRREIEFTESSLSSLKTRLAETEKEQQDIAKSTKQLETLLKVAGKEVGDLADVLGGKLTNALLQGKASSKQLEEAIEKIGQAAIGTNVDLEKMKKVLSSVDDGNSLKNVKKELGQLSKEAEEARKSVGDLGLEIENVAGALVAGGGIAGATQQALDFSSLNTRIEILFDIPEESKEAVKNAILDIQAYGIDGEAALEGVRRQWALNKDAADDTNVSIVKGTAAISSTISGVDFTELIQEVNEIAGSLETTNKEALALVDALLKAGFPPEQLDTIAEYGLQMKNAGFSLKEIQAIFEAGIDTKSWNIDNLNDGVKEARIRMAEFGQEVPKAMKELLKGTDVSAKQLQKWGKAVAEGGETGSKAMSEMATWLDGVEDKALQNAIATQIFGTMWEDQGYNLISVFQGVGNAVDKTVENTNGLYETMGKINADPAVQLQQAFTNLKKEMEPVLIIIAEIINTIATWIAENPKLAATIAAIASVIGILVGAAMALAPVIISILGLLPVLGPVFSALTGPIGIVIAAITGLIAIFTSLYKNNELFRGFVQETWTQIQLVFEQALTFISSIVQGIMGEVTSFFSEQLKEIQLFWEENGQAIIETVKSSLSFAKEWISSSMEFIKGVFQVVWPIISGIVKIAWGIIKAVIRTAVDVIKGIIKIGMAILQGDWGAAWDAIKDIAKDIMDNIVQFFEDIDLWQIGKDIIQGLIDGIGSMASAVSEKVASLAELIPDGLKDFLDINSPSRLVRDDVGKWIPAGLAEGIEKNVGVVSKAVNKMSQMAVPSVPDSFNNPEIYNPGIAGNAGGINQVESGLLGPITIQIPLDGDVVAQKTFRTIKELIDFDNFRTQQFAR